MLADELDYVIGVDPHRDEHVVAIVAASTGAVVTGTAAAANLRGYRALLCCRGAAGSRSACLGDRGHRQLRRRVDPLPQRTGREGARGQPHTADRAAAAWQGRQPRRGPHGTSGTRGRDARASTDG